MNLNNLIKSAEEKLANPDLTLGTRRREEAILHHLTSMKAETDELKCELQEAYNASNILLEANKYFGDENRRHLAEREVLHRTVAELESQNTELYIDLCEMEDESKMNTERVHLYTDDTETQQFFLGGNMFYELTIDKMIRHKWPEEKPKEEKEYLIRTEFTDDNQEDVYEACMVAEWQENELDREWYSQDFKPGFYMQDDNDMWSHVNFVTHWWNLPEVGNETI